MIVWRIIRKEFLRSPLSVEGAKAWPGRWHSAGTAILYTASTESLALLEKFVHLALEFRTIPHVKLCIELPEGARVDAFEDVATKPVDWRSDDPTAARALGDHWAKHSDALGLSVPSVLSSSERNVLLRASSPQFEALKIVGTEEFLYDERMWKAETRASQKRTR
ncbi:MAG TPA: RES family NAD+ phosphorylase [Tahibacter sp.]|uniref:RES family NAD+ phosphorylase n=1 Tax=Tahibacter sp. TaxID=2056211 RepID=UPI002B8DF167|nr:RES family NAD+ phosphorylase [Tahibacter sp.]HSX60998.1 RES family NAD+ phosphorylase [Tahibacter sp.]